MSVRLSEHLPLLAEAPDGIKKLRGLILELAVRGKLVPQDPNDEPASELLKRIANEKARLIAEGKIRKVKSLPPVDEDDKPFELPEGWAWCRLDVTAEYINGLAFKPSDWGNEGRPIIRIQNLSGRNSEFNYTTREVPDDYIVQPNDILVSWSATLDAFIWNRPEAGVLNQHIFRVLPSSDIHKAYLYCLLRAVIREMAAGEHAHGLAMKHINRGPFLQHVVALPPVQEQRRIAAKVDELMVLCDRMEAEQANAKAAHAILVQTLLGTLTQSRDAAELAANWQRLRQHFDTLFTTEASLDALKQTILQLAVMGRLVSQDFNDEPASELLKRIAAEKVRLVAEMKIKKDKPLPAIGLNEKAFELPKEWEWCRLGDLTLVVTDGTHHTPTYQPTGIAFISVKDIDGNTVSFSDCKFIPESEHQQINQRCNPERDDILLCRIGTLGRPTIVDTDRPFSLFVSVGLLKLPKTLRLTPYLHKVLSSPLLVSQYDQIKAGGSHTNKLNLGDIPTLRIPLPPLAEQHRIVAKADELMALCDRLKADLAESRARQARLATTLIGSALQAA